MCEERVTFEGLYDRYDPIVAADSQVIALGDIVSQDDSRGLADSREDCQQDSPFEGLSFIDDHKGVVERAATDMGQRQDLD
jgi:hypothetical protein